jgi:putative endonuclease
MYKIYILRSLKTGKYYIGQTSNFEKRLEKHNKGEVKSTKNSRPWETIHLEEFQTRSDACKRELEIKKYKGGILFKKLLGLWKE